MQFIGKPTSRPRILLKSIEKQKWWEAAGMTIFCADTGSEELDAPTGLGWDIATGPLSAENTKENLCAFFITCSAQTNKIYQKLVSHFKCRWIGCFPMRFLFLVK